MCESLVPVTREIGVTVAFESFLRIRLETNSKVTCLFSGIVLGTVSFPHDVLLGQKSTWRLDE